MMDFVAERKGMIVVKEENAGNEYFLFLSVLFSPLPAKPKGTLGLHSVCQSVHQSFRLSVRLSGRPSIRLSVSPQY